MHIPSERVYNEMRSEETSHWYVPANDGNEIALLVKAPTSSIKAIIAGCPLKLVYGRKESFLNTGLLIHDIPDAPLLIAGLQRHAEEHDALLRALRERIFPIFLFNELDVCLAWTTVELAEKDASNALRYIGEESSLYIGPFTEEASYSLDCFCFSVDNTFQYTEAIQIPTIEISTKIGQWQSIHVTFAGTNDYHTITIDDEDEGEMLERSVWGSLDSVFPLTLYKSPQVKVGIKMRELTDVFSFYTHGSFLIEAKDLSILQAGCNRNQERRTKGVQKQVKKAIAQLVGASKVFLRGEAIFDADGNELSVERSQPPHCIVLITDLSHSGDWSEIENLLMKAIHSTGAFFHVLDLRELISLLKGSRGKAELLDYNLIQRCKLFIEKKSVHIRSRQAPNSDIIDTD